MARSLVTAFAQEQERAVIDELVAHLQIQAAEKPASDSSPVAGKTVVFTGTLEKMSRAEAKARAEALGSAHASDQIERGKCGNGGDQHRKHDQAEVVRTR